MEKNKKSPEQELVESIGLMIDKGLESTTDVYTGVVKSVDGKRAVVSINGRNQNVAISSAAVASGNVVRVFVPRGNMSAAFIVKAESNGGGGTTTTAYGDLTGKSQINGVTLVDNKTSKELNLYGTGNDPPYPVTSVNGQTGDVTISTGGNVDSVNGKTGAVVLNKSDVGLGNVDNVRQYSTSNPPPYPVQSVDGAAGAVVTNAVKTTPQSLNDAQKQQARNNIGAGTSNFSGSYNDLSSKPTIPGPYTLPVANSNTLGGVKPVAKTDDMTQQVGVDANGALYAAKENYIVHFSFDSSTRKWVADKTTAEIKAVRDAGDKFIYAVAGTFQPMPLWNISTDLDCYFGIFDDYGFSESYLSYTIFVLWDDGTVTMYSHDVLAKDDISNNLNTDKTSTTKVPSCKATYDAIPHPDTKTNAQTQSVGMDSDGKLWTAPGGGGTGSGDMLKSVYDPQNKSTDIFKYANDAANDRQAKILVDGIIKGDGAGNLSAAVAGTDYAQDFVVTTSDSIGFNVTNQVVTLNKTNTEIITAINAGKNVVLMVGLGNTGLTGVARLETRTGGNAQVFRGRFANPGMIVTPVSIWIDFLGVLAANEGSNVMNYSCHVVNSQNIPIPSASDNGKFLQVVNGAWAAVTIPSANGGSF